MISQHEREVRELISNLIGIHKKIDFIQEQLLQTFGGMPLTDIYVSLLKQAADIDKRIHDVCGDKD